MNQNVMILTALGVVCGFGYHQYYVEPLYGQWQQQPLAGWHSATLPAQPHPPVTILEIKQDRLNVQTGQQQHDYPYERLGVSGDCTQLHVDQRVQDFCVYGDELVVRSLEPERIERYERVS